MTSIPSDSATSAASDVVRTLQLELINFSRAMHMLKASAPFSAGRAAGGVPVLARLKHHGPMRSSALAETCALDPSTVSRQVDSLVKAGLVRRMADPDDGRATLLEITEDGDREMSNHAARVASLLTELLIDWTPEQVENLTVSLRRLNEDAARRLPSLLDRPRHPAS